MNLLPVQSAQNPNYRRWKDCLEAGGIREHRQFILAGKKLVREFLHHHRSLVAEVLFPPSVTREQRVRAQFHGDAEPRHSSENSFLPFPELSTYLLGAGSSGSRAVGPRSYQLTPRLFEGLDTFGTHYPLVVGHIPEAKHSLKPLEKLPPPRGLEVILALQDPANLGAAIRSCAALNARRIVLTQECASPYLPKALRAASGMTFQTEFLTGGNLHSYTTQPAENLRSFRALDMRGESLAVATWPENIYLVVGSEGRGIDKDYAGPRIAIPMKAGCESLNAVQALTVALFRHHQLHGEEVGLKVNPR